MMSKHLLRSSLVGAALLLAGSTAWAQIYFGVALPLNGPRAAVGRSIKQGVDLAVADINRSGGILGKQLQAQYEDDGGETPEAAVSAVEKLLKQYKPPVVLGPHFDTLHLAVQRRFCGAALLVTGASGNAVTGSGCTSVLRMSANDEAHSRALVSYAMRSLQLYKIGVLHVEDAYGKAAADAVVKAMRELGLAPVAIEKHVPGATDLAQPLGRLATAGAQLVIVWTHDLEAAAAVRQARQLGMPYRMAGSSSMSQPIFIRRATAQAAQGTVSSVEFAAGGAGPNSAEFQKRFAQAYGPEPDNYAAVYYDAVQLAARAIAAAGSTETVRMREAATSLRYAGAVTTYRCNARGECNHQLTITEIDAGSLVQRTTMRF
ncbi:MAG TPA: ABC transporter substrate-binding protein [Ramlibacter sp.]|nr:ABC transporter substrate-binding protein [Ramlibacter sp.]